MLMVQLTIEHAPKWKTNLEKNEIRIASFAPGILKKFGIGISIKLFKDVSEHPIAPLGDSY